MPVFRGRMAIEAEQLLNQLAHHADSNVNRPKGLFTAAWART